MAQVLIVDDHLPFRTAVAVRLRADGHEVSEATDGAVALGMIRDGLRPDVVVLDMVMPKVDGLAFLGDLGPDGPRVIAVTAAADARDRAVAAGAADCLIKGRFALAELADRVHRAASAVAA